MSTKSRGIRIGSSEAVLAILVAAFLAIPGGSVRAGEIFKLDFSTEDDFLTPLVNGQDISTPSEFGRLVSISSIGTQHRGPAIFDSTPSGPNALGPDPDLLVNLGKILILQSTTAGMQTVPGIFDVPNDDADGGTLVFDFTSPFRMLAIDLIDIDAPNQGVIVKMIDGANRTRTYTVPPQWSYDIRHAPSSDGYSTLDLTTLLPQIGEAGGIATVVEMAEFDAAAVTRMTVEFLGSGAMDNLVFAPEPSSLLLLAIGGAALLRRRRMRA